ncbi:MAG: hypothetical protein AAFR47_06310 [Pseudomonadota bacterium]
MAELTQNEIEALLPFLANGTLEGSERTAVEGAVAADPKLDLELSALRAVRERMRAEEIQHSPGTFGLARLMRDVEREANGEQGAEAAAPATVVATPPTPAERVRSIETAAPEPTQPAARRPQRGVWVWQLAAAVACVGFLGQTLLTLQPGEDLREQLGVTRSIGDSAAANEAALLVIFAPGAAEFEIRALLLQLDLEIAGGPTDRGQYTLTGADIDTVRDALAAASIVDNVADAP